MKFRTVLVESHRNGLFMERHYLQRDLPRCLKYTCRQLPLASMTSQQQTLLVSRLSRDRSPSPVSNVASDEMSLEPNLEPPNFVYDSSTNWKPWPPVTVGVKFSSTTTNGGRKTSCECGSEHWRARGPRTLRLVISDLISSCCCVSTHASGGARSV